MMHRRRAEPHFPDRGKERGEKEIEVLLGGETSK